MRATSPAMSDCITRPWIMPDEQCRRGLLIERGRHLSAGLAPGEQALKTLAVAPHERLHHALGR